ncbi:MAG TPA: HEAT repeat domain-containing protein, partial [Tepidisphaeraceae bacterium]
MTHRRWISTIGLLGSLAVLPPRAVPAQTLPTTTNPSTLPSVPTLREIIESTDSSQSARDMAAIRLIAWREPVAHTDVVDILTNGPTLARVAVAKALAAVGWPDADFVAPLTTLVDGRDPVPAIWAAAALGQYHDNLDVMDQLIRQAKSDRSSDIRQAVIRALGDFSQKPAAQTLLFLMEHDDNDKIREAAGNALVQMTGRTELDHSSPRWAQWWQDNGNLPDDKFHDLIMMGRGAAFEKQEADHRTLENAADDYLKADFNSATTPEKRAAILLSYLQSPAPEIRELGAELVYSSAATVGVPPGSIEQTRLLLRDPSAEVRAQAAIALSADPDSAAELVAQLSREQDDFVRVNLIKSLQPFHDVRAINEM